MGRDTLLLIDGHSLVYRAFFAMPALTNSRGEVTNAAYGFTSMLLKALGDHRPTHAVAAFDPPGRTFRHEQDATYKAGRKPTPDDLIPQFPWCREVVEALSIPIIEVPTFEADDVIGTLSVQGERAGLDVIIVTGDLDALQLVTEHVRVFANRRGISDTIVYDVDRVWERYGFAPPLVVDFKALRGDISDNIPGVPGIGDKTAMSLVQEHGPLEAILAAVPTMKEGKVRRLLTEYEDQARLSKQLATIQLDMDIALDLEFLAARPARRREDPRGLRPPRVPLAAGADPHLWHRDREPNRAGQRGARRQGSLNFEAAPVAVEVEIVDDAAHAEEMAARLREHGEIALRTVVEGSARRGEVVGVALAAIASPDPAYYVPLGHEGANAAEPVLTVLLDLLGDASIVKHGYDLKQELLAWAARGSEVAGLGFDCMLAAYLCITTRTRVPSLPVLGARPLRPHRTARGCVGRQRPSPAQRGPGARRRGRRVLRQLGGTGCPGPGRVGGAACAGDTEVPLRLRRDATRAHPGRHGARRHPSRLRRAGPAVG